VNRVTEIVARSAPPTWLSHFLRFDFLGFEDNLEVSEISRFSRRNCSVVFQLRPMKNIKLARIGSFGIRRALPMPEHLLAKEWMK
jgi:hypothetical protein